MSMDRLIREEARLVVLKALDGETSGRLNSELLRLTLETYGIHKERAWVHDELAYLQTMGAIVLKPAGSVQVAELTEKGKRHLERHVTIEGVKRPSRPE